jgi:hypothetical protein
MRVIGTMVLIEQTMTKKNVSNYYDRWKQEQSFDTKFKIVGLGRKMSHE